MLGAILSAFTMLVTIKVCIDLLLVHPDNLDNSLQFLLCGSALAAYLLIAS